MRDSATVDKGFIYFSGKLDQWQKRESAVLKQPVVVGDVKIVSVTKTGKEVGISPIEGFDFAPQDYAPVERFSGKIPDLQSILSEVPDVFQQYQ